MNNLEKRKSQKGTGLKPLTEEERKLLKGKVKKVESN
jgi:hypothetical protein